MTWPSPTSLRGVPRRGRPRTARAGRHHPWTPAVCGRRAYRQLRHRAVPVAAHGAHGAGAAIAQHDFEIDPTRYPVALIARYARSPFARNTGCVSQAGLSAVRFFGRAEPSTGDLVEIEVGRPGLFASRHARRRRRRAAVRAEREFFIAAERLRGNIRIERAGEGSTGAPALPSAPNRGDEQMRARAVAPRVPVTHEQAVVDAAGRLAFPSRIELRLRAGEIGAVGSISIESSEAIAGRRDLEEAHIQRVVGHLRRLASGQGEPPHLRCAGARRQEVEAAPSGDQRGFLSFAGFCVSRRGCADFRARSTSHRSVRPLLASRSVSRNTYATWRPSGEICGSLRRYRLTRSCTVKAEPCWAIAGPASVAAAAQRTTRRGERI